MRLKNINVIEDDVESDLYAQDTMKNPGPEIIRLAFNDDLDHLERVMDHVTSDSYKDETGDDYFWNKHAKIISDNVPGDWKWEDVIAFWDLEDIDKAIWIYQNEFQRSRASEAEGDMNYDIDQADTRVALDWASIDGRLYDDILQAFEDEHGEGYYGDWVITANKEGGVEENVVEEDEEIQRLKHLINFRN